MATKETKKSAMKAKEVTSLLRMRIAHHILHNFVWIKIGGKKNLTRFKEQNIKSYNLPLTEAMTLIDVTLKALGLDPLSEKEQSQIVNVVFRTSFQIESDEKEKVFIVLRQQEIINYNTTAIQYTSPSVPELNNYTFLSSSKSEKGYF